MLIKHAQILELSPDESRLFTEVLQGQRVDANLILAIESLISDHSSSGIAGSLLKKLGNAWLVDVIATIEHLKL